MSTHTPIPTNDDHWLQRLVGRAVKAQPDEVGVLLWSAAYFFFLLSSYYILRPLRDELGTRGGVDDLPWLFTATLLAMLALNPIFSFIVARFPREKFIPFVYRFFALNILVFFLLMKLAPDGTLVHVGRAFYVWTAVFNLFVVSVFWGLMADVYSSEQAKRLFGFIAVGGTFGAICGSSITRLLSEQVTATQLPYLFLVSIILLEISAQCMKRVSRHRRWRRSVGTDDERDRLQTSRSAEENESSEVIGGSAWSGIATIFRSPYLIGISIYILMYTITSTYLYFLKIQIGRDTIRESTERIAFFANIDLLTNVFTVAVQMFLTSRIITRLGLGVTLTFLPFVTLVGFGVLGWTMGFAEPAYVALAITLFESVRRASNYALARPAREALYTVLGREEKYKSKSFIDTFIYRGGDQIGAWSFAYFTQVVAVTVAALCYALVPLAGLWLGLGLALGWRQRRLALERRGMTGAPTVAL